MKAIILATTLATLTLISCGILDTTPAPIAFDSSIVAVDTINTDTIKSVGTGISATMPKDTIK